MRWISLDVMFVVNYACGARWEPRRASNIHFCHAGMSQLEFSGSLPSLQNLQAPSASSSFRLARPFILRCRGPKGSSSVCGGQTRPTWDPDPLWRYTWDNNRSLSHFVSSRFAPHGMVSLLRYATTWQWFSKQTVALAKSCTWPSPGNFYKHVPPKRATVNVTYVHPEKRILENSARILIRMETMRRRTFIIQSA